LARHDLIAGLDIGTTKICCVVAEVGENGETIVSGVGVSPSTGLKSGVVVDIESTVRAIEEAVGRAARQAGRDVASVFVGVTGEHITSLNAKGVTAITHADREINDDDIERVNEQSRVIVLPPDRIILHAIPRSYAIDGQNGIRHPQGMSGARLEVETHIVTGTRTIIDNVQKCVSRAGLATDELVLEPLATSEAVILPAERNLGVCMVDIGGGTSDVAIFQGGAIFYSSVVPVGGNHVTNDLAQLFRLNFEEAEQLKISKGSTQVNAIPDVETVSIVQIGADEKKLLPRRLICQAIEARMQELFEFVQKEIMKSGCHDLLPAGLVLSGGGSQLHGAADTAGEVLDMPVRLGKPSNLHGLGDAVNSPIYSTAVGLVQFGAHQVLHGHGAGPAANPLGGFGKAITGFFSRLRAH